MSGCSTVTRARTQGGWEFSPARIWRMRHQQFRCTHKCKSLNYVIPQLCWYYNMGVSESGVYPRDRNLNSKNDDKPVDLGVPYFLARPIFSRQLSLRRQLATRFPHCPLPTSATLRKLGETIMDCQTENHQTSKVLQLITVIYPEYPSFNTL